MMVTHIVYTTLKGIYFNPVMAAAAAHIYIYTVQLSVGIARPRKNICAHCAIQRTVVLILQFVAKRRSLILY